MTIRLLSSLLRMASRLIRQTTRGGFLKPISISSGMSYTEVGSDSESLYSAPADRKPRASRRVALTEAKPGKHTRTPTKTQARRHNTNIPTKTRVGSRAATSTESSVASLKTRPRFLGNLPGNRSTGSGTTKNGTTTRTGRRRRGRWRSLKPRARSIPKARGPSSIESKNLSTMT